MSKVKSYFVGAAICLSLTLVLFYTSMGRTLAEAAKEALIVNTPAQPVPVHDINNPARQPFQKEIIVNLNPGSDMGEEFVFTVPAGQRLVVEHASATAFVPVGQHVRMFLVSRLNSQLTSEALVATPQGTIDNGRDVFVASHPVRLYAGPGDFVRAVAKRSDTAVNGFAFFTVAGYLIDEP